MNYEDLAPFVLEWAPSCPEPTMVHHLRQSAIKFCERTLAWQQDLDAIASVAGDDSYPLVFPVGAVLVKLLAFTVDGVDAHVVTPEKGRRLAVDQSSRDVAWTDDRVNVRINPLPAADGISYVLRAALKPTQASTTIADTLGEHYAAEIAAGALGTLLALQTMPWANPGMAADKRAFFEDRLGVISSQVSKGFSRGARQVRGFFY